jgi:hypothetical protein
MLRVFFQSHKRTEKPVLIAQLISFTEIYTHHRPGRVKRAKNPLSRSQDHFAIRKIAPVF